MSDDAVAVLGAGSWGTALAILMARNAVPVRLWSHDPAHAREMARRRRNPRYLSRHAFPEGLEVAAGMDAAASGARGVLIAVPSRAFRDTVAQLRRVLAAPPAVLAWGTKGFEPGSGRLLSEVVGEVFSADTGRAAISGPTFAGEIAAGLPAALTVASEREEIAERVAAWLRGDTLRAYTNDDIIGVQVAGAVKNVIAIAAGISDGLGLGANARAALITRGLAEIARLSAAMGGRPETAAGLAGIGDLLLTCTDDQSRNRRVGLGLAHDGDLSRVLASIGQEAEGVGTTRELRALAQRLGVDMPIAFKVYEVLFEGLAPKRAVHDLVQREPKPE